MIHTRINFSRRSHHDFLPSVIRAFVALVVLSAFTFAQSSDQNFPTHVTSNDINGRISARPIGDARLTTLFYLFEGSQGDIFINVATTNFTGDIDVYATDSMKPLTKMVMYADAGRSETGRLIYLRQSARLLLRIEGRTPNDDAATFRIKFAGSFVALAPETYEPAPTVAGKQSAAKIDVSESRPVGTGGQTENPSETGKVSEEAKPKTDDPSSDTVYENKSAKVTVKPTAKPTTTRRRTTTAPKGGNPSGSAGASSEKPTASQKPKVKTRKSKTEPPSEPDPLANIKLVVVFKDGTVIERPMTEISRFSFDNGRLTVVEKNGTITRYLMTDVAKVTIE